MIILGLGQTKEQPSLKEDVEVFSGPPVVDSFDSFRFAEVARILKLEMVAGCAPLQFCLGEEVGLFGIACTKVQANVEFA